MKWAMLVCVCACVAWAQVVPEREVEIVQALYDAGKYADAAQRANESLALTNFADAQRIKLHEIAGFHFP